MTIMNVVVMEDDERLTKAIENLMEHLRKCKKCESMGLSKYGYIVTFLCDEGHRLNNVEWKNEEAKA